MGIRVKLVQKPTPVQEEPATPDSLVEQLKKQLEATATQ
jgi:hypothetical protein